MQLPKNVMKVSLVAILCIQQSAWAAVSAIPLRPTTVWNAWPQHLRDGVQYQTFHRLILSTNQDFEIGNVISLSTAKPSDFDWAKLESAIREAFRGSEISQRSLSNARAFDIDWKAGNRVVRLFVSEKDGKIHYVTSAFRRVYAAPLMYETEILMRELAGISTQGQKRPNWLKGLVTWLTQREWVKSAYAAGCSLIRPDCNGLPLLSANINVDTHGVTNSINNVASSIHQSTGTVIAATNGLAASGNNIAGSVDQVAASVNHLSTSVDRTATSADKINGTIDKLSQEGKIAKLGAAAGVGFALSGLAVSLAATGVTTAAEFLFEALTHKKENADLLKRFIAAREGYEKSTDDIRQLENSIDSFGALSDVLAKQGVSREEFISKIGPAIEVNQARLKITEDDLQQAIRDENHACIASFSSEANSLRNLLEDYKSISKRYPKDSMCEDMQESLRKLKEAEGLLQQARVSILSAQDIWNEEMGKEETKTEKGLTRSRGIDDDVYQQQVKREDERRDRELAGVNQEIEDLVNRCVQTLSASDSRWFFAGSRRAQSCRQAIEGPELKTESQIVDVFGKAGDGNNAAFMENLKRLDLGGQVQKIAEKRRKVTETYDTTKAKRLQTAEEVKQLKRQLSVNENLARGLTDADNEWFAKILKDQVHSEERAQALQAKEKMIKTACGQGTSSTQ